MRDVECKQSHAKTKRKQHQINRMKSSLLFDYDFVQNELNAWQIFDFVMIKWQKECQKI